MSLSPIWLELFQFPAKLACESLWVGFVYFHPYLKASTFVLPLMVPACFSMCFMDAYPYEIDIVFIEFLMLNARDFNEGNVNF